MADLLTTAMDLMGIFGPFILISFGCVVGPRLWGMFRTALGAGGKSSNLISPRGRGTVNLSPFLFRRSV
ncbi:hypothetical protein KHA80_06455 [Anaerobacillus sp. HL2]|nr:hypothetical protein KHA80_06455 [Anaerobacillus sp. HL2]